MLCIKSIFFIGFWICHFQFGSKSPDSVFGQRCIIQCKYGVYQCSWLFLCFLEHFQSFQSFLNLCHYMPASINWSYMKWSNCVERNWARTQETAPFLCKVHGIFSVHTDINQDSVYHQKNSSPRKKCPVTYWSGGRVPSSKEEIFAEWFGGVEEESVPLDTQNLPLLPNGDEEIFSGNHPQSPCYATKFLSRADVTRLTFKTAHLMTVVSYILHVQCRVTCKCAFLADSFPILPQEKWLAMSSIREGAATVEMWYLVSLHIHHSCFCTQTAAAALWQAVLDKQKALELLFI